MNPQHLSSKIRSRGRRCLSAISKLKVKITQSEIKLKQTFEDEVRLVIISDIADAHEQISRLESRYHDIQCDLDYLATQK